MCRAIWALNVSAKSTTIWHKFGLRVTVRVKLEVLSKLPTFEYTQALRYKLSLRQDGITEQFTEGLFCWLFMRGGE